VKVQHLHWPIADPSGAGVLEQDVVEAFRRTRDEISSRLSEYFGAVSRDGDRR
jgi:hypothetical protein